MRLEFWPGYGSGPLWNDEANPLSWNRLNSPGFAARVRSWNSSYAEDKLPLHGPGDAGWLAQGTDLPLQLCNELGDGAEIRVTEPWWGETPS